MVVPVLSDQEELTYNNSARTQDVVWKTCRERLIIETNGKRESEKSMLTVQLDDDNSSSTITALASNNPRRLICHKTKKLKPKARIIINLDRSFLKSNSTLLL